MKGRWYREARGLFEEAVETEPWNREARLGLAELSYRRGLFAEGLEHVDRVLQVDAYDAQANFLAGTLYRALNHTSDARDAFGWAARSVAYRAALTPSSPRSCWKKKAGPRLPATPGLPSTSTGIASRVEDFGGHRKRDGGPGAGRGGSLRAAGYRSPSPFAWAEAFFAGELSASSFLETLGGEFPDQTLLELAIWYYSVERKGEAVTLLEMGARNGMGGNPMFGAWAGWSRTPPMYLERDGEPAFSFPFRPESLPVLEWAARNSDEWEWDYLLALNLWAVDRWDETAEILKGLGTEHRFAPLFVARGLLLNWLEAPPRSRTSGWRWRQIQGVGSRTST